MCLKYSLLGLNEKKATSIRWSETDGSVDIIASNEIYRNVIRSNVVKDFEHEFCLNFSKLETIINRHYIHYIQRLLRIIYRVIKDYTTCSLLFFSFKILSLLDSEELLNTILQKSIWG